MWSESRDEDVICIHRRRAFSGALVYGTGTKPSDRFYTDEATLIQFVGSLVALKAPSQAVIDFFGWLLMDVEEG
jgi:hypothetical protein